MLRVAAVLGLVALLVWCCLLFGIGLDDLTNNRSEPGVIFSVVVLPIFIAGTLYGLARLLRARGTPERRQKTL